MIFPLGTLVNAGAVIAGGTAGLLLHERLSDRYRTIVFQGIGLCVLALGMDMILPFSEPLLVIFSVVLGGLLGEAVNLEDRLERMAAYVKAKARSDNEKFTDGLITAFLLFCIGPMTVLGSFNEGLVGDHTLLFTKSMLDGLGSIALAATYGAGVLFSIVPLLVYQLGLTYFADLLQAVFSEPVVAQVTAVGGVLVLGIGVNLLDLKKIRLANLLPSLVVIVVLMLVFR